MAANSETLVAAQVTRLTSSRESEVFHRIIGPRCLGCYKVNVSLFTFHFSLCLVLVLALSACSRKADVKAQVSDLEKAFPAAAATAPAQPQTPAPVEAPAAADASAYVQSALAAVRQSDYAASVIALQKAQRARGVTAQQLMTVERAKEAIVADLVARADRGDPQAKAALAAIEKTHSQ